MKPFSLFFYEWLYGERGYYANFPEIGKSGDFFTAVSVTPLFGGAIANHIYRRIKRGELNPKATIFEVGAHRGYLLADIVQFLYTFEPDLINSLSFAIVEPFESLRAVQKEYFQSSFGDRVKLRHFKDFSEVECEEGFVVANEIFDAFPCELIYKEQMGYVEDFKIIWGEMDEDIMRIANRYGQTKGEVARGYERFAMKMAEAFGTCEFVTFDYGDLEVRNDFSIRVYTKHRVYPLFDEALDIKQAFGRSDITYDVNFSHLIDAFEDAGWQKSAYKTQMVALVDFGIMELLEKIMEVKGFELYKRELEKVKVLINPSMMGERFKMVSFIK
ncbi:MAG: hypothetical protein C6H99_04995 [Epsilonproteobacteria bacterium]|nr:hypothetical protein [Campylobacterota bacterium]NPA64040.1 hypothetical protein [Campylobacterota bacterium]